MALTLGYGLDDISIGSVYQCDTLTSSRGLGPGGPRADIRGGQGSSEVQGIMGNDHMGQTPTPGTDRMTNTHDRNTQV